MFVRKNCGHMYMRQCENRVYGRTKGDETSLSAMYRRLLVRPFPEKMNTKSLRTEKNDERNISSLLPLAH